MTRTARAFGAGRLRFWSEKCLLMVCRSVHIKSYSNWTIITANK